MQPKSVSFTPVTPVLFILIGIVVVGAIIAAAIYGAKKERERREALAAMAARLGWSFEPGHDSSIGTLLGQFGAFQQGHSRSGYNTMRGELVIDEKPYAVLAGDYTYKITRSSGKSTTTTTYNFSYVVVQCPFAGVPDLSIRRETFFDKIAGAMGFDDIDFESAEFSRTFHVKSSDRKFAFAVVHPRMMEFLLDGDPPPIDIRQGQMCVMGVNTRWAPEQFGKQFEFLTKFFDLWPDYLQQDLQTRTA